MKLIAFLLLLTLQFQAMAQKEQYASKLYDYSKIEEFDKAFYATKAQQYESFSLDADISHLSEDERKMLMLLFEVARIMDELFWYESNGNKEDFLNAIHNKDAQKIATINYGAWNRLDGNKPLFKNVPEKPLGANFYPSDMTKEEFEKFDDPSKTSLYTMIRRNEAGNLVSIPYHEYFKKDMGRAAVLLRTAADLAPDAGLKNYLSLRADALLTDNYQPSDLAWMDMKNNTVDFVVGPIENYEDRLYGYKAAHESFILIKDLEWSKKLDRYAKLLPDLQKSLPVEKKYKEEVPGSDSDLGVYNAIFYAGDCNAGSKTIAINLPNDPEVHIQKGSRKLQLKNSMQAKFDKILIPIAKELIHPSQIKHVQFNAFFDNTMFHEVAHGLGIKNTLNGQGDVRTALKETYTAIEESKADIVGLYLVKQLYEMKEIETDLMDNYVTFMAGIFRSIRFGATSAHGVANLARYQFFKEKGAFTQSTDGKYRIDFDKMTQAMNELSALIIQMQGDGNYEAAQKFIETYGKITPDLEASLSKLSEANIPVDIVFEQSNKIITRR